MKIAVLGAGNVGRAIGEALARAGHAVAYGGRVDAATVLEGAEVVVVAVPGTALEAVLGEHAGRLAGRLVIDVTNRPGGDTLHQLPLYAQAVPAARVFRAFCTIGFEVMADPVVDGAPVDLVYCGPDGEDRSTVAGLVRDVGFRPVYVGGLDAVAVVEGVTRLWFALNIQGLGRHQGIRIASAAPPAP